MKNESKKFAIGAAVAAITGFVAGILTAPKSGKETRMDIHNASIKAKAETEKKLKKLHSELGGLIDEGKTKASKAKTVAKAELDKAVKAAQAAKEKSREMLSAIHEGDAEDEDLKNAVKEAKQAAADLKVYLKK